MKYFTDSEYERMMMQKPTTYKGDTFHSYPQDKNTQKATKKRELIILHQKKK